MDLLRLHTGRTRQGLFACLGTLLVTLVLAVPVDARILVPDSAFEEGALDEGEPRVEARLITDVQQAVPGETFRVGVLFTMDPTWHVYWRNPGQSGLEPLFQYGGDVVEVGPRRWPAPEVMRTGDGFIVTYVYGDSVLLWTQAEVPEDFEGSEAELSVFTDYLACDPGGCIPHQSTLTRPVRVGDEVFPAPAATRLFDRFEERVPLQPEDLELELQVALSQDGVRPNDEFRLAVGVVSCDGAPPDGEKCPRYGVTELGLNNAFIPDRMPSLSFEVIDFRRHPTAYAGLIIELVGRADARLVEDDQTFQGLLHLHDDDGGEVVIELSAPLPRAPRDAEVESTSSPLLTRLEMPEGVQTITPEQAPETDEPIEAAAPPTLPLAQVLLFALLGGLLLNLMPCVLPVLAIKVVGFTNMVHESRSRIAAHATSYTAGILGAMMILAGVVLALQRAGSLVGWGFQFQEPLYITAVSGVLTLFALNLFGAFEIGVDATKLDEATRHASGHRRSFFEGVLAVVVATPCSAPFLGPAMGFALAQSEGVILLTFAAVGVGLALPFVVLSLVPGWARILPKPGPWMLRLKEVLGFALLATIVWLVWVIGRAWGPDAMARLLVFLLVVAIAAWLYGRVQTKRPLAVAAGLLAGVLGVAAAGWFVLDYSAPDSRDLPSDLGDGEIAWQPWSPTLVAAELAAGRVVFVDFTADWCISCKVNERAVIETDAVIDTVNELDVAMLVADWTRRDDRIREELARHGRSGIPLYLVYSPDDPLNPRVLPELITIEMVTSAMQAAAGSDG